MNHQNDSPLITTTEESAIRIDSTISLRGSQKPIRIECSNTSAASRPGSSGRHRRLGPRPTRVLGRDFMIVVAELGPVYKYMGEGRSDRACNKRPLGTIFRAVSSLCCVLSVQSTTGVVWRSIFCVEWKPRRMRKAMEPCNCGEEPLTKLACIETQRL